MTRLIIHLRPISKYLFIVWIIIIVVVSSMPTLPTPKIRTGEMVIRLDYLIHFCEYGLLAFLAYLSYAGKEFNISLKKILIITFFLIIFALLDEFHQKLIPGRSFNPKDILSNIIGILAALLFCWLSFRKTAGEMKSL